MLYSEGSTPPHEAPAFFLCPAGGNAGDELIRRGCVAFLGSSGIEAWESDGSLETAALANDGAYLSDALSSYTGFLFFTGGGNLGIYDDNALIRARIIGAAPRARGVLVFPQSCFAVEKSLERDGVTVWARDAVSWRMLVRAGIEARLVPDAALFVAGDLPRRGDGQGTLAILRRPAHCPERVAHGLDLSSARARGDPTFDLPADQAADYISGFDTVLSDRLHGALIALMLGKRTGILPVAYHKNRAFFDTWLCDQPGVAFVDSQEALSAFLAGRQHPCLDGRALFLEHARPAWKEFLARADQAARSPARAPGIAGSTHELVSITCMRDEQDIAEAFVRHTAAFVDRLIVLDNGSTDHTPRTLQRLAAEGLPLDVVRDPSLGYHQWERMTDLMRRAVAEHGARWVVPLDADEFLLAARPVELRERLRRTADPVHLRWVTYVPAEGDDPAETNPPLRMQSRVAQEACWFKVVVPAAIAAHPGAVLNQGNHDVSVGGAVRPAAELPEVHIAHLPVRTAEQLASKVAVSVLQFLAMHDRKDGWGFHLEAPYQLLKRSAAEFAGRYRRVARTYASPPDRGELPGIVHDPVPYFGGELRYRPAEPGRSSLVQILEYAEQLARGYARSRGEVEELRAGLKAAWGIVGRLAAGHESTARALAEAGRSARNHAGESRGSGLRTLLSNVFRRRRRPRALEG